MVTRLKENISHTITKGGMKTIVTKPKHDLIGTHTARRSFATNLFLSGFPVKMIMKITGHQKESTFYGYIKMTPNEEAKLLQLHWQKVQKLSII